MANNEQKSNKKLFIIFGLCSILALAVCLGCVVVVTLLETTEGTYEFVETQDIVSTTANLDTLNKGLTTAQDENKYFVTHTNDFSIKWANEDDKSSTATHKIIDRLLSGISETVKSELPQYETGEFGKKSDLPTDKFSKNDISGINVTLGKVNSETGEITDTDYIYYDITLKSDCESYPDCIRNNEISASVTEKIGDVVDHEIEYTTNFVKVEARLYADTLDIDYIKFTRNVTANVQIHQSLYFTGFAENESFQFEYTVTDNYDFSIAGIEFSQAEVYLTLNEESALSVNATLNDYAEYSVAFESADDTRVTIDEQGYAKGLVESAEPVEISVTLDYLGYTYTDTCLVYVTNPVEKIEISDKKMTLAVGDTATLTATLSPSDATIQDIIWVAEGDAATVENGVVTAVCAGTADIIAVSKDGYFRATCQVTVEGGATNG